MHASALSREAARGASRVGAPALVITALAAAQIVVLVAVMLKHLGYPFLLDPMEGSLVAHIVRVVHGQPIYPAPTLDYSALAYNPLFYLISAPLAAVVDPLLAGRLMAILGVIVAAGSMWCAVRIRTGSSLLALATVGLFAGAYRVMDSYLDTVHSDSWLLATALLGTCLLDGARTRGRQLLALGVLCASFWFKQHGALFAAGGFLWLLLEYGWRRLGPQLALLLILGPLAYLVAGPLLFGSHFLYFTWTVPSGWSDPSLDAVKRLVKFTVRHYAPLALLIGWNLARRIRARPFRPTAWDVQLLMAACSAMLGALDGGSSDNVFIPFGAFLIVCGVLALASLLPASPGVLARPAWAGVLIACSLPLAYNPKAISRGSEARADFDTLAGYLAQLPGPAAGPEYGYVPGLPLKAEAHLVALDDMARGPKRRPDGDVNVDAYVDAITGPGGPQYLLMQRALTENNLILARLLPHFVLVCDFGARFHQLGFLPRRFTEYNGTPRFLYRRPDAPVPACPAS